jgi:hypothetical protein
MYNVYKLTEKEYPSLEIEFANGLFPPSNFLNEKRVNKKIWFTLFSFKKLLGGDKPFANSISTDGYSISVHYTFRTAQIQKDKKSNNRKIAKAAFMESTHDMTETEKDVVRHAKAGDQQAEKNTEIIR